MILMVCVIYISVVFAHVCASVRVNMLKFNNNNNNKQHKRHETMWQYVVVLEAIVAIHLAFVHELIQVGI